MSGEGVALFDSQWMRIQPYLDGVRLDEFDAAYPPTWSEDAGGTALLASHGGTHRMQSLYLGPARSRTFAPQEWNFQALVATEEDYFRIERAKLKARRAIFAPFVWCEEVFDAVTGNVYSLSRPVAYGVAGEVDSATYPVKAFLDDVSSDASITLASGDLPQTFTAEDTGVIAVRYTPAYRVRINSLQRTMKTFNGLVIAVTMSEAVSI